MHNLWVTFDRKFVTKKFQKSPNLVTLVVKVKGHIITMLNYKRGNCSKMFSRVSHIFLDTICPCASHERKSG